MNPNGRKKSRNSPQPTKARMIASTISCETETVGRPFDPRLASAVATVENRALADGVVVEELRPGFLWHDELLRPAEVVVAKRRPKREISGDG